jgi:uncharacterized OsmC-like protein
MSEEPGYFGARHATFLADPVTPRDHGRGPSSATITIVEYGDFACPHSREAHGLIKGLLARSGDVRFVFRANPRSHFFPHAEEAAEAAEAAAAQGKYWEMHDLLFESGGALDRPELAAMARTLGLDVERFERELDAHLHARPVHEQEISGWHSHVLATPTFFVNGVRFDDPLDELGAAVARVRRAEQTVHRVFRDGWAESTGDHRRQVITVGPHRIVSDLPSGEGGNDAGPGPYDLLLAALGACTAMTVQWSAEKHRIPLRRVAIRMSQSRTPTGHLFRRSIALDGDLDEPQRAQLHKAAESCPVARTLLHEIAIDTRVTVDRVVEEAGEESFPASDPPPWTTGRDPGV